MKKPPVYINISRREGVIYSTAVLCIACGFLYGMKYMRSELAVTGMFLLAALLLFIAGTGIYSLLSRNFFYGKYDFEIAVTGTNITILEKISGKQDTIPWNDLVSIATWARKEPFDDNLGGDYAYEYHWCLTGNNGTDVTIPFYSTGSDTFVEKLRSTPGIDKKKLAAAMSGKKEGHAIVWQKATS